MIRQETSRTGRKQMHRLAAVAGAIIAAVLVWVIAHVAAGVFPFFGGFAKSNIPKSPLRRIFGFRRSGFLQCGISGVASMSRPVSFLFFGRFAKSNIPKSRFRGTFGFGRS